MQSGKDLLTVMIAVFFCCVLTACNQPSPPTTGVRTSKYPRTKPKRQPRVGDTAGDSADSRRDLDPVRDLAKPPQLETPTKMPDVFLTQQHKEACKVKVGDTMPDFTLPDTDGLEHKLSSLYGKLTVVLFWDGEQPLGNWELADLGPEVAEKYGAPDRGNVKIVAINHGQSAKEAQKLAEEAGVKFPVLLDKEGAAYEQIATRYLPRTYLLDAEGKILWLDLEYSRETQRHLDQAIRYTLGQM